MRVLLLTHSFYPQWGGTESYVSSLVKFFSRQNTSMAIYTYGYPTNVKNSLDGYNIFRNPFRPDSASSGLKYHLFFGIQQIADLYYLNKLKNNFDLIHVQGLTRGFEPSIRKIDLGVSFKGWKGVRGKPLVITFHEQINHHNLHKYVKDAEDCDAIICNNEGSASLLSAFTQKKVFYLPNGVDLEIFNPDLYSKKSKETVFRILCPSRLVRAKGILDLVKAADILINKQKLKDLEFLLIEGNAFNPGYQDYTFISQLKEQISSLNLQNFFRFIDGRPYYLMPQLYSETDVTVLPSYTEGFGLVIIEAMAMKKSVVATAVGDIPKIMLNNEDGLIIPPRDPKRLAESIEILYYDHKLRQKLGNAANLKVHRKYDFGKISLRIKAIYESLLA